MEIAIVSDTHMPRGSRRLPESCIAQMRRAELILHAGDFVRISVLRELERYGELCAVHGNVDDGELRSLLPDTRLIEARGATLGLAHDGGPPRGRLERLRARFPHADAVIFGHSHLPLHERAADGFQIFNPGSPTERRRAPACTMGIARVRGGMVTFELVALG